MRYSHLMSADGVRQAVSAAIAASTSAHADLERFKLACLPDPLPVLVHVDEFNARNLGTTPGDHLAWLVTNGGGPQAVFFDEDSGRFGACWGPDRATGDHVDIGFRSADPVEMYLV